MSDVSHLSLGLRDSGGLLTLNFYLNSGWVISVGAEHTLPLTNEIGYKLWFDKPQSQLQFIITILVDNNYNRLSVGDMLGTFTYAQ